MKIIEVIKECRARDARLWNSVSGYKNDSDHGLGIAYSICADMLEKTVHKLQKELSRIKADTKNGELSEEDRANAKAMVVMLEWVLAEVDT